MNENSFNLKVPNPLAQSSSIRGVVEEINSEILRYFQKKDNHLLVCGGGTSSRCASDGAWTLDMRRNYQNINIDQSCSEAEIESGVSMAKLLEELNKSNLSFPIGLSKGTGIGYILTGGISPLSRKTGLAIDQVIEIEGFWGRGDKFKIKKPTKKTLINTQLKWKALCGAAVFLAIVTKIRVKSLPSLPLEIITLTVDHSKLILLIKDAEKWPVEASLQWYWGEEIYVYIVVQLGCNASRIKTDYLQSLLDLNEEIESTICNSIVDAPVFPKPFKKEKQQKPYCSEIIGLLGRDWGENTEEIIYKIRKILKERPHKNCCIAAQQLGGNCSISEKTATSFVHRDSTWKPWITASWEQGDNEGKAKSLKWLEDSWKTLEVHSPGIHLAQIHEHLPWHAKELEKAFGGWLKDLKLLKQELDPNCVLPSLE